MKQVQCEKLSTVVLSAASRLAERGGGTYVDFAHEAQVSREASQWTVKNLVRSGKLCAVSRKRVAGAAKPLHVYVPAASRMQMTLLF